MTVGARQPWEPESAAYVVDAARALALLREAPLPALLPAPARDVDVRVLGAGWDNTVVLVGDALVVRFPRRAWAADVQSHELRVLHAIAERVAVPVPRPLFCVRAPSFVAPFWGHAVLTGSALLDASDDVRRAIAAPLGAFLRALHAQDTRAVVGELPVDTLARTDFPKRMGALRERLASFASEVMRDRVLAAFAGAAHEPAARACVVHGDLDGRHVLVTDGAITGVIDWGDVHLGDPAVDVAIAFSALPRDARAAFFTAYGSRDARVERVARLRALAHAVAVGWSGAGLGDRALVDAAAAAITRALDA